MARCHVMGRECFMISLDWCTVNHQQGESVGTRSRMSVCLTQKQYFLLASRIPASAQTSTVQGRNQATGPAMSPLENSMQRIVYRRVRQTQPAFRPVEQNNRANSSKVNLDGSWKSRRTFVEDFLLEHSFPGTAISSIEISGSF